MLNKFTLLCIFSILLVSACSKPHVYYQDNSAEIDSRQLSELFIRDQLYHQYLDWKDTPYKVGGLDKRGVDCSGFVHLSFRHLFDRSLPRTTLELRKVGNKVSADSLKSGDLLFFKTGWFTHHVGIYLENRKFIHASTSRGVMISNLNEEYWQDSFYLGKRLDLR